MRRLSVIDGIFLRTHQGMGTPIALQGLWRTSDPVDRARLDRLHDALRVGPLGRRVVRSGVPGARDRWQTSTRAHPLDTASAPLRAEEILPWADGRGADLDPRHGPGWRLSAAPLTDGGTVVALTCSHVLADARGLVIAVEQALGAPAGNGPDLVPGAGPGPVPDRDNRPGGSAHQGGDPESDWADAAETCATVLTGTARAARTAFRRARSSGRFRLWWWHEMPAAMRSRKTPAAMLARSRSGRKIGPGELRTVADPAGYATSGSPADSPTDSSGSGVRGSAVVSSEAGETGDPATNREPPGDCHGAGAGVREPRDGGHGAGPGVRGTRDGGYGFRGGGCPPESDSGDPVATTVPHADLPVPALVLRCPGREWDRIAAVSGGTPNSLFIWFVANTLWASGFPERGIVASLPVDTRGEPRIDNDLAMTEIVVAPGDAPGEIRAKSRAAYERRISSPGGLPEEFLHLVPDRVAYRLSRGAGERDILCSNIGPIPAPLHALGPHDCTGVAARAIHPGLTYARRPRTRLSGYLCRFRGDYLLTLASLDPERVSDTGRLHRLAVGTARRIGLPMAPW